MIPLTLLVAVIGAIGVMVIRPARAVGLLVLSMFLYPEYLRVPVGPSEMSAPRLIALALLVKLLFCGKRQPFDWKLIDVLVLGEWAWGVTATLLAEGQQRQVGYMIGRGFDTALMYFVARLSFIRKSEWSELLLPLTICAIAMCGAGVLESTTSYSPYRWLVQYQTWSASAADRTEYRFGLLRAQGSLAHPIYFGIAMSILTGLIYSLRGYCKSKVIWFIGCFAGFVAALSSMSSGPQQAVVVVIAVNLLYFCPRLVKPLLFMLLLAAIAMEMVSNRHFYYLVEYLNFSGGDYWYRARLLEVAVANLREYWLVGFGGKAPMHWGAQIDGRSYVDVVNYYVYIAINGGVLGFLFYSGTLVAALRQLPPKQGRADAADRQLAFGHAAILVAVIVASFSVGLFSGALLITYVSIGLCVKVPARRPLESAARAVVGAEGARGAKPVMRLRECLA